MKGFTLLELLISLSIISLIVVAVGTFSRDILFYNRNISTSLSASQDGRSAVKVLGSELREATLSSNGAFPIIEATNTAITFFSDIDNDGAPDQIRYYLDSGTLKKSVVKASGNPLTYASWTTGTTTTIAQNVTNTTSPAIFAYYDSNYTGTSSPLALPVSLQQIRLVKITFVIDSITFTTQVTIRNLKDNL